MTELMRSGADRSRVARVAVRLPEWTELLPTQEPGGRVLSGLSLDSGPNARRQAFELDRAGVVSVTERRDGLAIKTRNFVGRLAIGPLELTIVPKISWSRWLTLAAYALRLRGLLRAEPVMSELGDATLEDLLIMEFLAEARDLLGRGLHREYVSHREELACPRGRLDIARIGRRGGLLDASLPSRFTRRSDDSPLNRALLAGLQLAERRASDHGLRADARRLAAELSRSVRVGPLSRQTLREARGSLDRRTRRYEAALRLIEVLREGLSVSLDEDANQPRVPLQGFALDMNRIWQQLLGRILREWVDGIEVREEFTLRSVFQRNHAYPVRRALPRPRPDFAAFSGGRLLGFLDAKYRDLWELDLPSEMLYQLSLYALAQGRGVAAILYPAHTTESAEQRIDIHDPFTDGARGSVALRPVSLQILEELIRAPATTSRLERRRAFGRSLLGLA